MCNLQLNNCNESPDLEGSSKLNMGSGIEWEISLAAACDLELQLKFLL